MPHFVKSTHNIDTARINFNNSPKRDQIDKISFVLEYIFFSTKYCYNVFSYLVFSTTEK